MAQTAAHLVDNVMPWRPFRQIVLTVPKRIRFFLTDKPVLNAVIRIFMRALETEIRKACPDAPRRSRIGAAVFVQRSGSSLNLHVHLHVVTTVGVFASAHCPSAAQSTSATHTDSAAHPDSATKEQQADVPAVRFYDATQLTDANLRTFTDTLTKKVRKRVLRWMVKNNLLEPEDAADMLTWQGHGGFSVDASVHIPAHDRHGLERLLRYCARPPFAAERIGLTDPEQNQPPDEQHHGHHDYQLPDEQHHGHHDHHGHDHPHHHGHDHPQYRVVYQLPPGDIYGRTELVLTPFQFIQRLAKLIPPPRLHRNRYFGAFGAASPLRPHVVKFASADPALAERLEHAASQMKLFDPDHQDSDQTDTGAGDADPKGTETPLPQISPPPEHRMRRRASILWAMLLARIYEVLPLVCPRCLTAMKLISFITDGPTIEKILAHLELPTRPPPLAPARDPPQVEMTFGDQTFGQPNQTDTQYDPCDQTQWP